MPATTVARKMGIRRSTWQSFVTLEAKVVRFSKLDVRDPGGIRAGSCRRLPPRRRRPARSGDRSICRRRIRHHRFARQRRARHHDDAHWAAADGLEGTLYVLDHKPSASELTTDAEPRFPAASPALAEDSDSPLNQVAGSTWRGRSILDTGPGHATAMCPGCVVCRACRALRIRLPEMLAQQAGVAHVSCVSLDGEIAALAAAEADASRCGCRSQSWPRRYGGSGASASCRRGNRLTSIWPIRRPTSGTGPTTSRKTSKRPCASTWIGKSTSCRRWIATAMRRFSVLER